MRIAIKPVDMRFRVDIQYKAEIQNANGSISETWTNLVEAVPASILGLSGKELEAVGQQVGQYNARITIYKQNNLNTSNRILHNSSVYDIIDIIPDPTNQLYMSLMCRTGFTNG